MSDDSPIEGLVWPGEDVYEVEYVEGLEAACALTVREMERYYRDGRHPDLSVILKACRKALEVPNE
jgi:predicted transcriptional regulator